MLHANYNATLNAFTCSRKSSILTLDPGKPKQNLWDNPTHAGPKTWNTFHGPRLRTDAELMERMDRAEDVNEEWEAKKAFVNTVRVQTLDRFYSKKVENEQKEMASTWAPHRRDRAEYHKYHDTLGSNLDNMPVKELKKVLTPFVLHRDREAINAITKRIHSEEKWKKLWKEMELARRAETLREMDHSRTYNAMLMELAGQQRIHLPLEPHLRCSPRVDQLARPADLKPPEDITQRTDFAGLFHVDHRHAMEARFPGSGHAMTVKFTAEATQRSRPDFLEKASDPPAQPPEVDKKAAKDMHRKLVRQASIPVSKQRLQTVSSTRREDPSALAEHSTQQFLPAAAPPPPDQGRMRLKDANAPNKLHMSLDFLKRSDTSSSLKDASPKSVNLDLSPPARPMVYPVSVPNVEEHMPMPNWRPKRSHGALAAASPKAKAAGRSGPPERWPPVGSQTVDITIVSAAGLPKAGRKGCSDPQVIVEVPGKSRSTVKTSVASHTESPVWNEPLVVQGWRRGEPLAISVVDAEVMGGDDQLAAIQVPSADIFPNGFEGRLEMQKKWVSDTGMREEHKQYNSTCRPTINVKISLRDDYFTGAGPGPLTLSLPQTQQAVSMPDMQPTTGAVCAHLDDFEAQLKPASRLGNFWMTPR
ncbi:Cytosolic phospholipase A2 delta [Durusdinium trenchii]|uniref:Cytosolic phospholipase A2 delta n=2 Tax=Durusdinium trenchii TaxID=1381693 RepID=A0ABP0HEK4_9DINO